MHTDCGDASVSTEVTVKRRDFGGCTIVTVPGDVEAAHVDEIRASAAASGHVVLDLARASAVHPSAVTALAALHRRVQAQGGGVCIVTKEDDVRSQVAKAAGRPSPAFYDEIGDALEASIAAHQAAQGSQSWAEAVR